MDQLHLGRKSSRLHPRIVLVHNTQAHLRFAFYHRTSRCDHASCVQRARPCEKRHCSAAVLRIYTWSVQTRDVLTDQLNTEHALPPFAGDTSSAYHTFA